MLPGEPKSLVTRDLALLAYCQIAGVDPPDIADLLRAVGVDLPAPKPEYRRLDARVAAAKALGAVPYRPTPTLSTIHAAKGTEYGHVWICEAVN